MVWDWIWVVGASLMGSSDHAPRPASIGFNADCSTRSLAPRMRQTCLYRTIFLLPLPVSLRRLRPDITRFCAVLYSKRAGAGGASGRKNSIRVLIATGTCAVVGGGSYWQRHSERLEDRVRRASRSENEAGNRRSERISVIKAMWI